MTIYPGFKPANVRRPPPQWAAPAPGKRSRSDPATGLKISAHVGSRESTFNVALPTSRSIIGCGFGPVAATDDRELGRRVDRPTLQCDQSHALCIAKSYLGGRERKCLA
jgi:hypothetical protein